MRIRSVRSIIVPALLIAVMAPAARGQDSTATAPPPAPVPQSQDTTATAPPPAPAPQSQDTTATAPPPAPVPQSQDTTATAPPPAPAPQSPDTTTTLPPAAPTPDTTVAPVAAPATPQAAALDSVPAGRALLYLFNGSGRSLLGGKLGVKCDGKKLAELPRTTFSVVALDPGPHKLQTTSGGGKLDLTAESGQRYFVLAAYWPEKSWATTPENQPLYFAPIEEARARELIPRSRRNEAPKQAP